MGLSDSSKTVDTPAPFFCVYAHEHGDRAGAEACDKKWDESWRGSICGLHDAGLRMLCTCSRQGSKQR